MEITAEQGRTDRLLYIDVLNIISCFGVVVMHCTGKVFVFDLSKEWNFCMILQALFHFSIPVFFMLTGATLMNYREKYSTKKFFRKRLLRTVIPLLIWSSIMLFYRFMIGSIQVPKGPRSFLNLFFNNEIQNIYWFFYAIIAIYIAMPLFSLLARKENLKTIKYFLIVFFIVRALFPLIRMLGFKITPYFEIPGITSYFGYVLMGWYLRETSFPRKIRFVMYGSGVAALILMVFGTRFLSLRRGMLNSILMDYTSVCTFLLSLAVFVFFKEKKYRCKSDCYAAKILRLVSQASLGVYVLQMIPLTELGNRYPGLCTIPFIIAKIGFVYVICLAITLLIQRIPLLKKIMP